MTDDSKTLTWMDACGRIVDLKVPARVADALGRGEAVAWSSAAEPRRQSREDALRETGDQLAVLKARRDQIDCELGDIVSRNPWFKSAPRFIPPDD